MLSSGTVVIDFCPYRTASNQVRQEPRPPANHDTSNNNKKKKSCRFLGFSARWTGPRRPVCSWLPKTRLNTTTPRHDTNIINDNSNTGLQLNQH